MGLADQVRELAREVRWELAVEAESQDAADAVVRELVETTNLFANPNKHRYALSPAVEHGGADAAGARTGSAPDTASMSAAGAGPVSPPANVASDSDLADNEVAILVSERESADGASILSAIQRLGVSNVVSARKWVRWRVSLTRTPVRGEPEVFEIIRRIGVTTSRHDGLLSNPHSQISRAVLPWGEEKPLDG